MAISATAPTVYNKSIILQFKYLPGLSLPPIEAFSFVVAHELVHVFDYLMWIVPAFIDWKMFWMVNLKNGSNADLLLSMLDAKSNFIDRYYTKNEMLMVKEFWPSQARKWFKAARGFAN